MIENKFQKESELYRQIFELQKSECRKYTRYHNCARCRFCADSYDDSCLLEKLKEQLIVEDE